MFGYECLCSSYSTYGLSAATEVERVKRSSDRSACTPLSRGNTCNEPIFRLERALGENVQCETSSRVRRGNLVDIVTSALSVSRTRPAIIKCTSLGQDSATTVTEKSESSGQSERVSERNEPKVFSKKAHAMPESVSLWHPDRLRRLKPLAVMRMGETEANRVVAMKCRVASSIKAEKGVKSTPCQNSGVLQTSAWNFEQTSDNLRA